MKVRSLKNLVLGVVFFAVLAAFFWLGLRESETLNARSTGGFSVREPSVTISGQGRSGIANRIEAPNTAQIVTDEATLGELPARAPSDGNAPKTVSLQSTTFIPEKSTWRDGVQYQWRGGNRIRPLIRYSIGGGGTDPTPEWFADSIVASTASPETVDRLQKGLAPLGVSKVESLGTFNTVWQILISPENAEEYLELKEKIRNSGYFSSVDHDLLLRTGNFSNDALVALQYSLGHASTGAIVQASGGGYTTALQLPEANIKANTAWATKRDCTPVRIGVLDSGIASDHPDLAANINTSLSRNFVSEQLLAMNCENSTIPADIPNSINPAKYGDDNGHGTHVAGTIGAVGNNSMGVAGVCWKAEIVSLRAMNPCGSGATSHILAAVQYAAANKIKVLNMSVGGSATAADVNPGSAFYNAINLVTQAGGLVIAAAGNSAQNISTNLTVPASINNPGVITVGAHNAINAYSVFSNFSNTAVHIAAPGEAILSTFPMNKTPTLALNVKQIAPASTLPNIFKSAAALIPNNGYNFLDGTSMAAPHVAGIVALVWSLDPTRNAASIKSIVLGAADQVPTFLGQVIGGRRVNLQRAVAAIGGYAIGVDQASGLSQFEGSIGRAEPILVRFAPTMNVSLQGAKLRLDSVEIGMCSDIDKTCVGRIPDSFPSLNENTSMPLSVVATSSTIPAGSLRVLNLSNNNGLFAANTMSSSCRVLVDGKVISSFRIANMTACRNVCRALIAGTKRPGGECRFADQSENLLVGMCNAN
ncbi:MAG: hypothetical protein FJY29_13695 [Betaproteobacteria bacterium]|nr:hypothetical protein [Betaproteobacteria bacterium]